MTAKKPARFVCPWCGFGCQKRYDLTRHWATFPECGRNRNVNSQSQTKNLGPGETLPVPGEHVLRLVEERERDGTPEQ